MDSGLIASRCPGMTMKKSPAGSIRFHLSSPICKNIPVPADPNQKYIPRRLVPQRGVSRSSRTRGGMRWTRQRWARDVIAGRFPVSDRRRADERCCCGRQSRVVLAPVAGVKFAEARRPDRVQTNLNPRMTVTRRIRRRGGERVFEIVPHSAVPAMVGFAEERHTRARPSTRHLDQTAAMR